MPRVIFGPFLCKGTALDQPGTALDQQATLMEPTGWGLEFSGAAFAGKLDIYQRRTSPEIEDIELHDYLVRSEQIPFAVRYSPFDSAEAPMGRLLSLNCVICALYSKHDVALPLTTLITELWEKLPLKSSRHVRRRDGSSLVPPKVREAGFEVTDFFSYGTGLVVQFAWIAPQDRARAEMNRSLYAAAIRFRPGPGRTLGKGKWMLPLETTVYYLMAQKLRSLLEGDPHNWLSEQGVEVALGQFKFTKVSLLTRKELRNARLEFIRQRPDLHDNPRELARAMQAAELYSELTEPGAIMKQLPRLFAEL